MSDAREDRIQDYLDDRMNDGERRAFEERLANDDGLAERVNDLRAISEALGQDAPELPPGFHTRLRARFEARHAPARQWFRPLSWETAGLVAAVPRGLIRSASEQPVDESPHAPSADVVEHDR